MAQALGLGKHPGKAVSGQRTEGGKARNITLCLTVGVALPHSASQPEG